MNKVIFVVGPTATGKTNLAVQLAKQFNGELVSADSIQIYKNLDIVSGKDLPSGSAFIPVKLNEVSPQFSFGYHPFSSIPVYMLDIVYPEYSFSVSEYVPLAIRAIKHILDQKKLPIIVGGTGFYSKALLDGIETMRIPPDKILRKKLENLSVNELQIILKKEDNEKLVSMSESDRKNKRRLVRAIEIAQFKTFHPQPNVKPLKIENVDVFIVGLKADREIMKKRVSDRVGDWVRRGAIEEAERLFRNYQNLSNQVKTAIGYRELFSFLSGNLSREDLIPRIEKSILVYVKKQMTFFKRDTRIHWFDISDPHFTENVFETINLWYNRNYHDI